MSMIVYIYISVISETIQVQPIRACVLLHLISLGLAWEHWVLLECIVACTYHAKVPICPIKILKLIFLQMTCCYHE